MPLIILNSKNLPHWRSRIVSSCREILQVRRNSVIWTNQRSFRHWPALLFWEKSWCALNLKILKLSSLPRVNWNLDLFRLSTLLLRAGSHHRPSSSILIKTRAAVAQFLIQRLIMYSLLWCPSVSSKKSAHTLCNGLVAGMSTFRPLQIRERF